MIYCGLASILQRSRPADSGSLLAGDDDATLAARVNELGRAYPPEL